MVFAMKPTTWLCFDYSCPNAQRNLNQLYKFVEKENKEKILTCLFCLVSDVSSHSFVVFVCYYCIVFYLRRRFSHLVLRIKHLASALASERKLNLSLSPCDSVWPGLARTCVDLLSLYVPVKSKLKHPSPGNPPGIWIFEKFLFKIPPPEAEKLFKFPIIGPFQVIKCPHPRKTFQ